MNISPTTTNIIGMELVEFVTTGGTPEVTATQVLSTDLRYTSGRVSPDGASMVAVSVGDPPEQHFSLVLSSPISFDPVQVYGPSPDGFINSLGWAFAEVDRRAYTGPMILGVVVGLLTCAYLLAS